MEIPQEFADWLLTQYALSLKDVVTELQEGRINSEEYMEAEADKLRTLNRLPSKWSDLVIEKVKEITI